MIEVGGLFPGAISRPVTVGEAFEGSSDKGLRLTHTGARIVGKMKQGDNGKLYAKQCGHEFIRLTWYKPSPTLNKNFRLSGAMGLVHPFENRHIGIGEAKRIQSYPDAVTLFGDYNKQWERIGNSVPPLLMRAIAAQIRHKLWGGNPLTRYPKTMTYPEILEAAWQDHLSPRDPDAPTVISTFAGGGGSSLGYSMAGYRELLAVEWDDNAVETFKLNFPDVPVYHGDIAKLSVKECMELAGVKEGELDLLDGSPPCQGVSTAGKRDLNDPRNQLFREFVRLLRGLKPKVFVMENVPGLVKGKMKLIFAEIMRELKASGYQVRCKKLNAMYFYVPQSRERLIFIGVRDDLGIEASHPKAESRPVTVGEAQSKIDWIGISSERLNSKVSRSYNKGRKRVFYRRDTPYAITKAGGFGGVQGDIFVKGNDGGVRHPSAKELGVFQSYPDHYRFTGEYKKQWEIIGNSVPPLLMRSVSAHIKAQILAKTTNTRPELIE